MANSQKKSHWGFLKYEKKKEKRAKSAAKIVPVGEDQEGSCKGLADHTVRNSQREEDSILEVLEALDTQMNLSCLEEQKSLNLGALEDIPLNCQSCLLASKASWMGYTSEHTWDLSISIYTHVRVGSISRIRIWRHWIIVLTISSIPLIVSSWTSFSSFFTVITHLGNPAQLSFSVGIFALTARFTTLTFLECNTQFSFLKIWKPSQFAFAVSEITLRTFPALTLTCLIVTFSY